MTFNEDELAANEFMAKIDRMAEIKRQQETLKQESAVLEGYFLQRCQSDLENTKYKTVSYSSPTGNKVTATMAVSVKDIYPSYYPAIFGVAYADAVTEKTTYTLTKPAARMLAGLWKGEYLRTTIAEAVEGLPCNAAAKGVLIKKLKGINFNTDKKNLMTIGGFSEAEAEEYAYLISEAAVWENFVRMATVTTSSANEQTLERTLKIINSAIVVEETPKISIEAV